MFGLDKEKRDAGKIVDRNVEDIKWDSCLQQHMAHTCANEATSTICTFNVQQTPRALLVVQTQM